MNWWRPSVPVAAITGLVIGLCVAAHAAGAGEDRFIVSRWTIADGLPQSSPNALALDHRGYLWVGTELGLARFDGFAMKVWDTRHGLPGERVVLLQDSPVGLYVATEPGALSLFADGRFRAVLDDAGIRTMALDHSGTLWIGTTGQTFRVDPGKPAVARPEHDMPNGIHAFLFGRQGGVIVAHDNGISRRKAGSTWQPMSVGEIQLPVRDLEYIDGQLWVAARNGYWSRADDRWVARYARLNHAPGIALDPGGGAWLWSRNAGVLHYRGGEFNVVPQLGGRRTLVFSLLPDGPDTLWVGVADEGLLRLKRPLVNALTRQDGLPMRAVHGVLEDRAGNLWLGSLDSGITRIRDGQIEKLGPDDGLADAAVMSIAESEVGEVWVGTTSGLARYRAPRFERVPYPPELGLARGIVSEIIALPHAGIAFITQGGVYSVSDGHFAKLMPRGTIRGDQFLYRDSRGWLWAGGTNLCVLRPSGLECFTEQHGLPSSYLRFAAESVDGSMRFGSYGGGLCAMIGDARFRCVSEEQGLPHRTVHNLLRDDLGWLWIPSNLGLTRLAPGELEQALHDPSYTLRADVFGLEHGLPDLEFNGGVPPRGVVLRDGRLALPTMNGLALVDPKSVTTGKAPAADINGLLVDGAGVGLSESGRIPPGSDRFSFRYTAIQPSSPQAVRFRYRLHGHDEHWLPGDPGRTAAYTGLHPGAYRFEVQASAGSGPWGDSAILPVRLLPHFWQTPWFLGANVILLLALATWFYRLRVRRLLELERLRLRIATDLHDELGSELSGISLASALLEDSSDLSEPTRRTLGDIRASVSHLLPKMRDIVWLIDPEKDRVGPLAQRLQSIAEAMTASLELEFRSNAFDLGTGLPMAQRRDLLLLYRELLSNVARHAGASRVQVRFEVIGHQIELEVRDDGRGFEPGRDFDGAGLRNMRQRAAQLDADFSIESTPGSGARALLRVPMTRTGRGYPAVHP